MGRHRMERPGQPHVLRDVRVPAGVRLHAAESGAADDGRAPQGQGGGRRGSARGDGARRGDTARLRALGDRPSGHGSEAEGREGPELSGTGFRAIRGGGAAARFAAAEAVLLRGLVGQGAEIIGGDQDPAGQGPAGQDPGERHSGGQDPGGQDPGGQEPGGQDPGGRARGGRDPGGQQPADQLEELFALSDSAVLPDDPVLARLLPDAYSDDPEAAGEFRRYTEHGLRSGKLASARTVLDTLPEDGGRVRLSADEAQAWLRCLNDVRLALGVRLEVSEDREAMLEQASQGGPQAAGLWIYDWLTLLQETLVEALW